LTVTAPSSSAIRVPPAFRVFHMPFLNSTMNEAYDREARGECVSAGDVYLAERQSGTGSRGPWYTGPGDVALTCVLDDVPTLADRYLAAAAAGLAVIDGVKAACRTPLPALFFKWPNDVFTADNCKLAGTMSTSRSDPARTIWLERERGLRLSLNWLLIGVGINLGAIDTAVSDRYAPTSVENLTGMKPPRDEIVSETLHALQTHLNRLALDREGFVAALATVLHAGRDGAVSFVPPGFEPPESYPEVQRDGRLVGATTSGFVVEVEGRREMLPFESVGRIIPRPHR